MHVLPEGSNHSMQHLADASFVFYHYESLVCCLPRRPLHAQASCCALTVSWCTLPTSPNCKRTSSQSMSFYPHALMDGRLLT